MTSSPDAVKHNPGTDFPSCTRATLATGPVGCAEVRSAFGCERCGEGREPHPTRARTLQDLTPPVHTDGRFKGRLPRSDRKGFTIATRNTTASRTETRAATSLALHAVEATTTEGSQGGVYYSFSRWPATSRHSTYLVARTTPIKRSFR